MPPPPNTQCVHPNLKKNPYDIDTASRFITIGKRATASKGDDLEDQYSRHHHYHWAEAVHG
jgi:hypothetical protein